MEFHQENISRLLAAIVVVSVFAPVFDYIHVGPAVIRQQDIAILLTVSYVIIREDMIELPFRLLITLLPLSALLLYGSFLTLVQPYPIQESMVELIQTAEIILFSLAFVQIIDKKSTKYMFQSIFIISIIGSILSLYGYFVIGKSLVRLPLIPGISSFGLYYGVSSYVSTQNRLTAIGVGLILIQIVISETRSKWIFIPTAGIIVLSISGIKISELYRTVVKGLTLSSVLLGGIFVILPDLRSHFFSIFKGTQGFFARPVRYYIGVQVFQNHMFGVGLGNFGVAINHIATQNSLRFPQWLYEIVGNRIINKQVRDTISGTPGPHSDIFKLLVESGLIGLSLFISFWLLLYRSLFTGADYPYRSAIQATIVYIGFQSVVNTTIISGGGITLMFFLCVDAYNSGHLQTNDAILE